MELREGVVVAGRFRLERELGKGAMGVVWRARHLGLDIPCAVKVIRAQAAASPEHVARFEREAKAAAQIRSPHVVQLLDHGVWEGLPYMAMELLEGEDLEARLERVGRLGPEQTVTLFRPLTRALKKAHDMGLVHRDIKPANIFLAKDGDEEIPKILDFGIVKDLGADTQTRAGSILGTPYYLSPEQARSSRDIDHRSDLWSLAVVIYRCVVGRLPFNANSLGDLITQILTSPVPVPSQSVAVPPGFDAWWARATARNPAERFQNAQDFMDTLATALVPAQAPSATAMYGSPQGPGPQAQAPAPYAYGQTTGQGPSPGYGPSPAQMPPAGYGPTHAQGPSPGFPPAGYGPMPGPAAPAHKGPPWLAIGLGCGGLAVLSVIGLVCVGFLSARPGPGVAGGLSGGSGLTQCGGPNFLCTATKVPDPAHADPVELLPWVRELALQVDSRVKLTTIIASEVTRGTVALSDVQTITYQFGAPGTTISVTVKKAQTVVSRSGALPLAEPISEPTCSLKAAWKAAVGAGLSEGDAFTFLYTYETTLKGPKMQLSTNHGVADIHPTTCAVRSSQKW